MQNIFLKCIFEHSNPQDLILNNLQLKICNQCGLVWQEQNSLSDNHYDSAKIDTESVKIEARTRNCKERIRTFKKYTNLNNLCDIGCGEGLFLKILKQLGFKNLIGIEPNSNYNDFIKENELNIFKGTLNDLSSIVKIHDIHTISLFHVIEHLKNPLESLKTIGSCLNFGDYLIIETPNFNSYSFKKTNYGHKLIYPEHLFYFNEQNIKKLLESSGFKVMAGGRRDFDQNHLGIKDSLFRLGIIKNKGVTNKGFNRNDNVQLKPRSKNFIKVIIGFILSKIVSITNRQDYIWVIGQKI